MNANKIFFDIYSTGGGTGMTKDEYRHYYEQNNVVYIVLVDAGIYTEVERPEMFERGMARGCFIDVQPFRTPKEAKAAAMRLAHAIKARRVSPDEFIAIEQERETRRVAAAFAIAEEMIARG